MKLAIIGSRTYRNLVQVRTFVLSLPRDTLIITGGARGVDLAAEEAARERRLSRLVYEPRCEDDDPKYKSALHARNSLIVKACDRLIAFHDGTSRGTLSTIGKAREAGKFWKVVGSDDVVGSEGL